MSSLINPYNIDGTFPIAGQDNSSQGFRDNFTNIKNNFLAAESEITDLQSKAITTSALNGQTLVNNMAGTQITAPQLKAWTQAILDLGVVSSVATLDFTAGNFQKITTGASITLNFTNWPASTGTGALGYGVLRVWIVVTNANYTIRLPANVNIGVNDIAGYNANTNTLTFDTPGNYVFDFSSIDGGTDYLIFDLTRSRASFRDPSLYYNNTVVPTLLVGYTASTFATALGLETGQDTISALGSYNSVGSVDASLNNINTAVTPAGTPGYTITSTRGNLALGTLTPVQSGDFLGFVQSYANTGGVPAVDNGGFQQTAAIGMYAVGTGTANGIGGNIGFFTRQDGASGNVVVQAMSINNDQSVEVMGNLRIDSMFIEYGTYYQPMSTGQSITLKSNCSTVIIDTVNSAAIAQANIILPSNPVVGQTIRISSVAPLTLANVWAPSGAAIKYIPTNYFANGNVNLRLTYLSGNWYRT